MYDTLEFLILSLAYVIAAGKIFCFAFIAFDRVTQRCDLWAVLGFKILRTDSLSYRTY